MEIVAHARSGVQLASVVMLLISSTGVFLPLEVALNRVWGVTRNRSYLMNQLVSLGLAAGIGTIALMSVAVTAAQQSVLRILFFGHINNAAFVFFSHWLLADFCGGCQCRPVLPHLLDSPQPQATRPRRTADRRRGRPLLGGGKDAVHRGVALDGTCIGIMVPFSVSVSLMLWAFITGLLLLAGAHYSASRHALRLAHLADLERAKQEKASVLAQS